LFLLLKSIGLEKLTRPDLRKNIKKYFTLSFYPGGKKKRVSE
jgi:hypothetical protein